MSISIEESNTEKVSPLLNEIVASLLQHNKSADLMQKEFLFSVILVTMIENGYRPVHHSTLETIQIDANQLMKWKSSNGLFEAALVFSGFEKILLKLIMSPLGATALVNLIISDMNCETYCVCLPVSRYVVSPQASTIPMIFRDLRHLSVTLKNKLLSPVRSRVLNHYGFPSASLWGLPEEVLHKIILYLPISDIGNMAKTCLKFKFLLSDNSLWHELYKRDFEKIQTATSCTASTQEGSHSNWKIKYKDFKEKVAAQANKSLIFVASYSDFDTNYVPYVHPEWSDIIM